MAYTNHLLLNNVFLRTLSPSAEEIAAARHLVHASARDWYGTADLSTSASTVDTWIRPLLNQQSLDLVPAELPDPHAWSLVAPWDRQNPLALCYVLPQDADLDGHAPDGTLPKGWHWMIQAVNLARRHEGCHIRWVVLTNGRQWRLLDACSLRRYEAFLEIDLYHLLEGEDDPMAAYLFYRLLRLEGSLERDADSGRNSLDLWLEQSVKATEATELYLKSSVSDNLDTPAGGDGIMAQLCLGLVQAIDPERNRVFTETERDGMYRDAAYLLYRLLFVLYAEARHLLPMDRADYRAVSLERLIDEAVELRRHPPQQGTHPTGLWTQLYTLFSAIQHSDEYLGIPPYNGGLFDDKDKPYLRDYAIEDRFLAEALCQLAFLCDPKGEQPLERIDYRDLSVRHLGNLYEGMIEYKLFIAEEKLYARRAKNGQVQYLSAAKTEARPNDEVVEAGRVYFAQSPHERKATGTHYTPEELVDRLVQQTVVRLLDERWTAFSPQLEAWLQEIKATPDEGTRRRLQVHVDSQLEAFVHDQVLSLRICDPAMGSGHFLVHIAYTITNFILQVLSATPWDNPAVNLDAGTWRRLVVERCLYGVDISGMAVELAKLSLWLATMLPGRPLSFLDHHLKRGNSLLGARLEEITAVLTQSELYRESKQTRATEAKGQYALRQVPRVTQELEHASHMLDEIAAQVVQRAEDIALQEKTYQEAQDTLAVYGTIGTLLVARKMGLATGDEVRQVAQMLTAGEREVLDPEGAHLLQEVRGHAWSRDVFNWELEYPTVFAADMDARVQHLVGFDVVIGNPPFLGGYKIRGELGSCFVEYLRKAYAPAKGQADLCGYVFRRAFELTRPNGYLGMIATNTIGQGDTREASLAAIIRDGGAIISADRYVRWPGDATVEVNLVSLTKNASVTPFAGSQLMLDGRQVPFISSWLDDYPETEPRQLRQNSGKAFIGDAVRGMGFILHANEATTLLADFRNAECVLPYLSGQDLNSDPLQAASRYVICFQDWSLETAREYPALLQILEDRVMPVRAKVKEKHERENWWLFARYRGEMRRAISDLDRVLIRAVVSDTHAVIFASKTAIFNHKVVVFAFQDDYHFAVLQSWPHELWMRRHASTMRTDINYSITDCFNTFPFPMNPSHPSVEASTAIGYRYHEHRRRVMLNRGIGLTPLYTLVHSPNCTAVDVVQLRQLQVEMDYAILRCYQWGDIDLHHSLYANERGKTKFMPSQDAQREIFTRLTALNQEIARQEAAQGLSSGPAPSDEEESDADET